MPARIIETNDSPLNIIDVDGITVDLIENALKNAREEMAAMASAGGIQGTCRVRAIWHADEPADRRGAPSQDAAVKKPSSLPK